MKPFVITKISEKLKDQLSLVIKVDPLQIIKVSVFLDVEDKYFPYEVSILLKNNFLHFLKISELFYEEFFEGDCVERLD